MTRLLVAAIALVVATSAHAQLRAPASVPTAVKDDPIVVNVVGHREPPSSVPTPPLPAVSHPLANDDLQATQAEVQELKERIKCQARQKDWLDECANQFTIGSLSCAVVAVVLSRTPPLVNAAAITTCMLGMTNRLNTCNAQAPKC